MARWKAFSSLLELLEVRDGDAHRLALTYVQAPELIRVYIT